MENLIPMFQAFLGLGPTVILPVAVFFLGMLFGQTPGRSFRSGLIIGVGFTGIFMVVDLLVSNLAPAAQGMVHRFGIGLNIIDIGWPGAASIAWASPVAALVIPVGLVVNIIMLVTKTTKTMDIDLWNYWHFTFCGAFVYSLSGSLAQALIAAVIFEIVVLKIADWTAPLLEEYFELPGISVPTGSTVSYAPIGIPLVWLIQKIPGIKDLHADPDTIQKRFGIFGEPIFMGLILGCVLGGLAGYDLGKIVKVGVAMGAVMFLMPRMVKILMEGLIPISESAREFLSKKFGEKDVYIGLDAAVAIGHPSVIATALILVPITILLAVILPGNKVLPFGDLATIPFIVCFIVGTARGNIIHSVIAGTVVLAMSLYMATDVAVFHTQMAVDAHFKMPEGTNLISSIDQGGNLIHWLIYKLFALFN
ncbi:PTS system IIC component, Gat family [Propionispora vibrioides]|uniref:PTS system IIC component, Gat family n=2 Tax=Propionispora vibrioides TaxID=112903 RepID=A0A1H8VNR4_9FIRM|nr:PTS galactitol transporter subunit IIC [Propionispora vibrioides]SEP17049.1 PTS system IIC component, Gat family [Propionispora vibrioides]